MLAVAASVSELVLSQIDRNELSKGKLSQGVEVQFRPIYRDIRVICSLLETGHDDGCAVFSFSLCECFSQFSLQVMCYSVNSHSLFMVTRCFSRIDSEFCHFGNEVLLGKGRGQVEKVK